MRKLKKVISVLSCAAIIGGTFSGPYMNMIPMTVSAAEEGSYAYESHPGLQMIIGWEGDRHAALVYADGSYWLRDRDDIHINFGVSDAQNINWYNKEGYLPCSVSEFEKDGIRYTIESFGDEVSFKKNVEAGIPGNRRYVMLYSRMKAENITDEKKALPAVSSDLMMPINDAAKNQTTIAAGETVVRDWCIAADRFRSTTKWLTNDAMAPFVGTFDEHYEHMKNYWNTRLDAVVDIKTLPSGYEKLIEAYKAGYINTMIIKDGDALLVGEAEYDDWTYDHDWIGILSTLMELGDYQNFRKYVDYGIDFEQYPDGRWKYSWPFALYLQKTGDMELVKEKWEEIKENTHLIETQRTGEGGIMQKTNAIDSNGYWLIDNWSALTGLTTYKYLCDALGETEESEWATSEYTALKTAVESRLTKMQEEYDNFAYLPISMEVPNPLSLRRNPLDANWGAHFMFGRWAWDGYLFGAEQDGMMLDLIDDTYTYNFYRQEKAYFEPVGLSFGGYPGYSSGYNAGYGSAALRGEEYRDVGIKAYQWMIDNTMSGPYSWHECIEESSDETYWSASHASERFGSCPHAWGYSVNTKALLDSLLSEKSDGTRIIGRGIPNDWIKEGEVTEIENIPVTGGKRMGFTLTASGNDVTLNLTGDVSEPVSLELSVFVKNIASVSDGISFDNEKGAVTVPAGTTAVTVTLMDPSGYQDPDAEAKKAEQRAKIDEFDKAYGDVRTSYGTIPAVSEEIVIDAQKDSMYDSAAKVNINQLGLGLQVEDNSIATGTAYLAWKDGYLYCYADILDNQVVVPTEEQLKSPWSCESLEFYLNPKDNDVKCETKGYRIGMTGYASAFNFKHNVNRNDVYEYNGDQTEGLIETAGTQTDTGWAVEFKVPMEEAKAGQRVGIQFMINDVYINSDGGIRLNYIRAENVNGGDTWDNYGYGVLGEKAEAPRVFEDVQEDDWFCGDVNYVSAKGIMTGLEEKVFGPAEELSRAQFATILYRMAGSPDAEYTEKFADVKEGEFYTDAVMWASEQGIVTGYVDTGLYAPEKNISREELAVMMRRYAKYCGQDVTADGDLSSWSDGACVSEFAKEGMSWAVANNVIKGAGGELLNPQASANRAECAAIIHRYMEESVK